MSDMPRRGTSRGGVTPCVRVAPGVGHPDPGTSARVVLLSLPPPQFGLQLVPPERSPRDLSLGRSVSGGSCGNQHGFHHLLHYRGHSAG